MTLLEKRSERLRDTLFSSLKQLSDDVTRKRVHRLRTTTRRIESLMAFAEPQLGKKHEKALENLVALRKRAGRVRDFDVQLQLLGAIGNTSAAGDRKTLADEMKRKRAKHAERLRTAVARVKAQKFDALFERVAAHAAAAPPLLDESDEPLQRARRYLMDLANQFSSSGQLKGNAMHDVRIRLKKTRYLAELGQESAEQKNFLAAMKITQDSLGEWHDWEELVKTAEEEFGGRVNCPLLVEIRALFAAKHSAALAAVSHLFAMSRAGSARRPPRAVEATQALAQRA